MNASVRQDVAEFFERFEGGGEVGSLFHAELLNLDPVSVGVVTREQVLASLPLRKQFFARLGITGMRLASLTESPIDDSHTLARTTWRLERDADSSIADGTVFTSTFLLRRVDGAWQIVVYLNHQDLRALTT